MRIRYQVIYWRDIPAQVKLQAGKGRMARPLSGRFQETIDRAAMLAEATSAEDYLEMWRTSDWQEREGEPEQVAEAIAAELETRYTPDRLLLLEQNGGYEREGLPESAT